MWLRYNNVTGTVNAATLRCCLNDQCVINDPSLTELLFAVTVQPAWARDVTRKQHGSGPSIILMFTDAEGPCAFRTLLIGCRQELSCGTFFVSPPTPWALKPEESWGRERVQSSILLHWSLIIIITWLFFFLLLPSTLLSLRRSVAWIFLLLDRFNHLGCPQTCDSSLCSYHQ